MEEIKKEPIIMRELELNSGEIYLGELSDRDKYQVLMRHFAVLEQTMQAVGNQNTMLLTSIFSLLEAIAKKNGIDTKKVLK